MGLLRRDGALFWAGCAVVLISAAGDAIWMGLADLPCPRGDDAFYKSPAAELVQTGRLTQPSVVGYLPRAEEVFAAYPPLYQLAVAAWFALFGFSTGSAVAFGHAVHLLNMAAVMALVARALPPPPTLSTSWRCFLVAAAGILYFGFLRSFDRPEELALLPCWLGLLLCQRGSPLAPRAGDSARGASGLQRGGLVTCRGAAVMGTLLGLCGMVSPWTGLVFAGVIALREIQGTTGRPARGWAARLTRATLRLTITAVVAALPVALWLAWLEWGHPHIVAEQFLEHIRRSEKTLLVSAPWQFPRSLGHSPYQWPALAVTLIYLPRLLFSADWRQAAPEMTALGGGALAGFVVASLTRVNSYNYMWICLVLLFPCFAYLAGRLASTEGPGQRRLLAAVVAVCALTSLRDPVSLSLIARDLPLSERPASIEQRLTATIPPGDIVATTSRHWYFFQGRNPWRNTAILPWLSTEQHRQWQWIVLPADYDTPEVRAQLSSGFELVEEVPSAYQTVAPSFYLEDRTWAYALYRRRDNP